MPRQKRGYRWTLFVLSIACFLYTIFYRVSVWSVAFFFLAGGAWYWLERRKTRELDALPPDQRQGVDDE